jgi:hypothetical protein
VTGRRGRRIRQLQNDIKDMRGYCKLNEEALDALCGELALKEAMDLLSDRPQNE